MGFVELPWSHSGDLEVYEHDCCNMIQPVAGFVQLAFQLVEHYVAIPGQMNVNVLGVCLG